MSMTTKRSNWSVLLLCAALVGFSCQAVEYTGRSQVNLVSEGDEKKLGVDAYDDILKKTPLSKNQAWQAQLKRVGQRISAAAAKPEYEWAFNVLAGKDVNAFCLPGGKVAFWEGIMPVAQDDAGVAVVMGHEVAHALARHGAERMSQSMGAQIVGQVLGAGAEILHHYLTRYALRKKEMEQPNGNLARATYSAYNGGPGALGRYRGVRQSPTWKKVDEAFWDKFQAVSSGQELAVKRCYG